MADDKIPEVEFRINPDMSDESYIRWNVEGASRRLRQAPQESDITLMVYNIHKDILRDRGASESDFAEGDKVIDDLMKEYRN